MLYKYTTKYFSFSPGIPWKIKNNKYIMPEISKDAWNATLYERDIVIMAFGGLLESFFSLSVATAVNKTEPYNRIFWAGNEQYIPLINANGITTYKKRDNISEEYPVPLFIDKEKNAYFNCLNNYLFTRSYLLRGDYENIKPVIQQIFSNALMPWLTNYIPKINYNNDIKYNAWKESNKFFDNKRYILICIDDNVYSNHSIKTLDWSWQDVLNFAASIHHLNIDIIVCSNKKLIKPYYSKIFMSDYSLEMLLPLIKNSWMVLSNEIDILFLAMSISKASILYQTSSNISKAFDIYSNVKFLHADNMIFSSDNLNPGEVYILASELE